MAVRSTRPCLYATSRGARPTRVRQPEDSVLAGVPSLTRLHFHPPRPGAAVQHGGKGGERESCALQAATVPTEGHRLCLYGHPCGRSLGGEPAEQHAAGRPRAHGPDGGAAAAHVWAELHVQKCRCVCACLPRLAQPPLNPASGHPTRSCRNCARGVGRAARQQPGPVALGVAQRRQGAAGTRGAAWAAQPAGGRLHAEAGMQQHGWGVGCAPDGWRSAASAQAIVIFWWYCNA